MQVSTGWKIAGAAVLGVGAAIGLAACGGKGQKTDGPFGDLSAELMKDLVPSWRSGGLDVATQAVRQVRADDGHVTGSFDGTRLLRAADSHAYGTPEIGDPAIDVQGDGKATFNEVRQVVRHFDTDRNDVFSNAESVAFEREAGLKWLPGQ